jgi:hypothetical protein
MLRALDVDIVALREELDQKATDRDIFKHLAGSDRVFVSEDQRQLTRICEAGELKAAGISAIYFAPFWGKLGFWAQAAWLVRRWPTIDDVQRGLARGTIMEIKQNGKSLPIAL